MVELWSQKILEGRLLWNWATMFVISFTKLNKSSRLKIGSDNLIPT
jgi:hypothetical protein